MEFIQVKIIHSHDKGPHEHKTPQSPNCLTIKSEHKNHPSMSTTVRVCVCEQL